MKRYLLAPTLALACVLFVTWQAHASVIEDFEDGDLTEYKWTSPAILASVTTAAAHDGMYGLEAEATDLSDWIYRDDGQVHVEQGDWISYWVRTGAGSWQRQYSGFGATADGCYSTVMAENTNQFLIQYNEWYGFVDLASTAQTYLHDHWYRVEVHWDFGGAITADLYDSDGVTLLNTVSTVHTAITQGGIAFRGFSTDWTEKASVDGVPVDSTEPIQPSYPIYFDTIERSTGPIATGVSTWGSVKALYR